jgi:ADP-heptose:LPS heptosyltransferase/glycosyltransferase involved in cell wall biosynthesis
MNKTRVFLKAPVLTQSGYGVHSRQILMALLGDPKFDVYVENIRWGNTPFLTADTEEKKLINEHIHKFMVAKTQGQDNFDLFIHVTIPNEFEKLGKINIGVTAGIETDRVSHVWLQKCNEMDLIIVPSEHSKRVLEKTMVDWTNQKTGESGTLRLTTPLMVCSEGVNTNIFYPYAEKQKEKLLEGKFDFESDFNFLHVGQWGKGGFGDDRKNIANLVKYFIETFKGQKDVGLVLKTNMARNSSFDCHHVTKRLQEIKSNWKEEEVPPIYLVHGNLTDEEMADLYNHPKIKAFVSLTHGEGFGLPLLEAAACGLPILATNWSGHLDFLKKGKFSAIEYDMTEIPPAAVWGDILIEGSRWATVKEEDAKRRMKKMVSSYYNPKQWAKDLAELVQEEFDLSVVCQNFADVVSMSLKSGDTTAKLNPVEFLQNWLDTPDDFNVIYTMPMSTGDVFISTAVIDGVMKELPEGAKIYFATKEQYAGILKNNPHIHKVIPWADFMMNTDLLEEVFDLALMPNTATQFTFSNYVRRGQGRRLAEEFANHCIAELGEYHIELEDVEQELPETYMTFHPGSGKGQWEARKYVEWEEVLNNLKNIYPELKVVQVGSSDEPPFSQVDVDLKGATNYQQLAKVIKGSVFHLSIDTFSMHLAAALETPLISLFGSSHAKSSGPWVKNPKEAKIVMLEADQKMGCNKACYKYQCRKNKELPCINEIDPQEVVAACCAVLGRNHGNTYETFEKYAYQRVFPKISGYTTTYNLQGYPFKESIKSMLGFCDEVIVVDGFSDDGTYEELEKLAEEHDNIELQQIPWDKEEPGMDGMMKAYARAFCTNDFLWQQDCDEVVHENDYEKIKMIAKRFPNDADILHLPVIELWGNEKTVTGRRHCWKWRMSRNKPEITHGINAHARLTDEKTGKVYARDGMSDGCEYVNVMSYEPLPHVGFYNQQIEMARQHMPERYAEGINEVFDQLPSVFHYSWCSLENKINQFKNKWDRQWNVLYQTENKARFPEADTPEKVKDLAQKLYDEGGEDSDQLKYKFELKRSNPAIMEEWLKDVPLNSDKE